MLSTYCQHCGSKNEYRLTKPKFCSSCGQPSVGAELSTQKPQENLRNHSRAIEMQIDDEDGTDVFEVPHINNLEYEIEVSANTFKLGSILPEQPKNTPQKKKRGRPRKNG
jgi:ribosomal protein L37E